MTGCEQHANSQEGEPETSRKDEGYVGVGVEDRPVDPSGGVVLTEAIVDGT